MSSGYEFTVYRGTFIQLPRLPDTETRPKPVLMRNRGALWVSTVDGRIKGCDWQAREEDAFRELMSRNGWVDVDAEINGDADASLVKVKIVTASEERNEFFFPGFTGTFPFQPLLGHF